MLLDLHDRLRAGGLKVSLGEWLTLIEGLSRHVGVFDVDRFHRFARLCLIKDQGLYDRFDVLFGDWWAGRERRFETLADALAAEIPDDWLALAEREALTDEQRARVEALGGWETLMETLARRLEEQREAHHGGSKWIGTGGTSPFGHGGHNPEGVRIGGGARRRGRAAKVWERRVYRDLDGTRELGTRNFRMALRKLRRLARDGRPDTLDLDATIRSTARRAGLLDVRLRGERRNAMRLVLLLDVGGSMDPHAALTETLFAAARSEFRRLDVLYFHNFPYERLWRENARRDTSGVDTAELIATLGRAHRLVIVGDATMSPYEIAVPGGSVEHWNEESGAVWLGRLLAAFPHAVWLNPEPPEWWSRTPSIRMTRELVQGRMHPLSVAGIGEAIETLKRPIRVAPATSGSRGPS